MVKPELGHDTTQRDVRHDRIGPGGPQCGEVAFDGGEIAANGGAGQGGTCTHPLDVLQGGSLKRRHGRGRITYAGGREELCRNGGYGYKVVRREYRSSVIERARLVLERERDAAYVASERHPERLTGIVIGRDGNACSSQPLERTLCCWERLKRMQP